MTWLTPTELGRELGIPRRQVIAKCMEYGVPVFQGRIEKVAFTNARARATLTSKERYGDGRFKLTVEEMHKESGGAVAELLRQRDDLLARNELCSDAASRAAEQVSRVTELMKPQLRDTQSETLLNAALATLDGLVAVLSFDPPKANREFYEHKFREEGDR